MAKIKKETSSVALKKSRPSLTPEARENQLIALAYDRVEERLINGTATSQETTHFLRLGSQKARLEMEKLKRENELLTAKAEAVKSTERIEKLYSNAIAAMRGYSGQGVVDENIFGTDEADDI